ncbi:LacI family transcriptional regulator [Clostridiaceae bacterium AF18-31LB]|nr:LacI family transcriptional regulator [Clostridiaceae bacterium AF18-31LB]RHW01767.1 LacI family transcriptional regulator [Clostridiaceae bacterium OF09-1]
MAKTLKQLAQEAGVSIATVSKVVNGRDEHISEATRKRIRELVENSGYRPNAIAKGLKEKKTNTIGFILPDISNPFFPEIARGIEDEAKKYGFAVVFCNTDNDVVREESCISFLRSKMVDGLIFTQTTRESVFSKELIGNIPVVVVDRGIDTNSKNIGKIYVNCMGAIYDATCRLIRQGCEKIAFISANLGKERDYRYEGYEKALKQYKRTVDPVMIFKNDYNEETGYQGIQKICRVCRIDGLVCGNDLIATGAIQALSEGGWKIPEDIKIVGLDDVMFAKYLSPPLTTIAQPAYEMGKEAAKMLIRHITNGEPLYSKELPYEMRVRSSG